MPAELQIDVFNVINLLHLGNKNEGFRYITLESRSMPDLSWTSEVLQRLIDLIEKQTGYLMPTTPGPAVGGNMVWRVRRKQRHHDRP